MHENAVANLWLIVAWPTTCLPTPPSFEAVPLRLRSDGQSADGRIGREIRGYDDGVILYESLIMRRSGGVQRLNWRMKCQQAEECEPGFPLPHSPIWSMCPVPLANLSPQALQHDQTTPDSGAVPPARTLPRLPGSCGMPCWRGTQPELGTPH